MALSLSALDEMVASDWAETEVQGDLMLSDAPASDSIQSPLGSEAIITVSAADLWADGDPEETVELLEMDLAILSEELLEEILG